MKGWSNSKKGARQKGGRETKRARRIKKTNISRNKADVFHLFHVDTKGPTGISLSVFVS